MRFICRKFIFLRKIRTCMKACGEVFVLYREYESGGRIFLNKNLNKSKSDYNDLLNIARSFAGKGHIVVIPGTVHYKDPLYKLLFKSLIGTRYYRKCPDLIIDDSCYEYESYVRPWSKRKSSNMLSNGLRQSDCVILDNNKGASDRFMRRLIISRIRIGSQIKEVWLFEKGKVRMFWKRKQENPEILLQCSEP